MISSFATVGIRENLRHLASIVCGFFILYYTFDVTGVSHVLLNMFLMVIVFQAARLASVKNVGYLVSGTCVATLLLQCVG